MDLRALELGKPAVTKRRVSSIDISRFEMARPMCRCLTGRRPAAALWSELTTMINRDRTTQVATGTALAASQKRNRIGEQHGI